LIISGQAAPGILLRLAPLAERVGASPTPVREALLLLAQDGWVVQEPNRGFRVAPIRRGDVKDAYLVQAFVAGELAGRAAKCATPADIKLLEGMDREIRALDVGEHEHDHQRVEDLNYFLHRALYDIADSPRLVTVLDASIRYVPRRFWATIPGWLDHNRGGHAAVIAAIAAGDSERARQLMAGHINGAETLLFAHLDGIGFWESAVNERR
jgi:DNA-binding GntR family transcriptional regulator